MNDSEKTYAGIDMGSVSIKAVLVDSEQKVLGSSLIASGGNYQDAAKKVLESALGQAGLTADRVAGTVITGLGAERAPFPGRQVSDISCQAMGMSSSLSRCPDSHRHRRTIHKSDPHHAPGAGRRFSYEREMRYGIGTFPAGHCTDPSCEPGGHRPLVPGIEKSG